MHEAHMTTDQDRLRRRELQAQADAKIAPLYGCFLGTFLPEVSLETLEKLVAALPDVPKFLAEEAEKTKKVKKTRKPLGKNMLEGALKDVQEMRAGKDRSTRHVRKTTES